MRQLRKYELVKFGLDKVGHPRRDRRLRTTPHHFISLLKL